MNKKILILSILVSALLNGAFAFRDHKSFEAYQARQVEELYADGIYMALYGTTDKDEIMAREVASQED